MDTQHVYVSRQCTLITSLILLISVMAACTLGHLAHTGCAPQEVEDGLVVSRRRGDRTWRRYIGSGTASKARGSRMRPSRLVSACMMELRATTQTARFISSKHSPAQPVHAVDGISTAHTHQQRLVEENSSSRETHLLSCRAEHGAETCHRPMPATTPPRSRDEAQSGMLKPDGRDRSPRPLIWPPDVAAAKEIRCLQARQGNATRNVTCSVHSFRRLPYAAISTAFS